jgi:hypothetical protein
MFNKLWIFCGSMRVNFWLLLLISLNLGVGACYTASHSQLFSSLSHLTIQDWINSSVQLQMDKIWWLFSLLCLLSFLGFNTVVCVIKELSDLWNKKKQMGWRLFSVRICPALIHLCFIFILFGHSLSLVTGFRQTVEITPGIKGTLSSQAEFEVTGQSCDRYLAPAALKGLIKNCSISLKIKSTEEETKQISVLSPSFWNGISFHLTPSKQSTVQDGTPALSLIVKKDPGIKIILWGFATMILLMLWYYAHEKIF